MDNTLYHFCILFWILPLIATFISLGMLNVTQGGAVVSDSPTYFIAILATITLLFMNLAVIIGFQYYTGNLNLIFYIGTKEILLILLPLFIIIDSFIWGWAADCQFDWAITSLMYIIAGITFVIAFIMIIIIYTQPIE